MNPMIAPVLPPSPNRPALCNLPAGGNGSATPAGRDGMLGSVLRAVLFGAAGFIVGAVAGFFAAIGIGEMLGVSQAEGAFAMQAAFFWAPLGGLAGMIAGIALARRRSDPPNPPA